MSEQGELEVTEEPKAPAVPYPGTVAPKPKRKGCGCGKAGR